MALSPFFVVYLAAWMGFCALALLVAVHDRRALLAEWRRYAAFLNVRWKLALLVPALLFVTFAGRFTDDETWDGVTGGGMSILTFLTAPWAVGAAYQVCAGRRPLRQLLVALALLFFSSCWFYDGYLLWRDGAYTVRWLGNLMLSPFIYLAAGLLWNLEATGGGYLGGGTTVRFSFTRADWPTRPTDTRFGPLVAASLPLILVAAFVLLAFVGWRLPG